MALLLQYALAVVYVAWLVHRYYGLLDLGKQLQPLTPGAHCHLLASTQQGEPVIPTEDLVLYRPGLLIGGAGATLECLHHSPERARPGFLLAVDVRHPSDSGSAALPPAGGPTATPVVTRLVVMGLPEEEGFRLQPHGLFYSRRTERLYVVNHGGASGVGSRVEMFDVREGQGGLPSLAWRMSIGGGHRFGNMVLNSVVEGAGNDVFVTQFQNFALPVGGGLHPKSLSEKMGRVGQFMLELLALGGFTGVHHCVFDPDKGDTNSCRQVASGFVHANGLTTNAARSKLWVSDPVRRSVTVYSVEGRGGKVELTELTAEHIALPHAVDNLHLEGAEGGAEGATGPHLFAGSIPLLYEQLSPLQPKHGTFLDITSSSSSEGAKFDTFADLITHDGLALTQLSACYRLQGSGQDVWGVCGSPLGDGLLACEL